MYGIFGSFKTRCHTPRLRTVRESRFTDWSECHHERCNIIKSGEAPSLCGFLGSFKTRCHTPRVRAVRESVFDWVGPGTTMNGLNV
jgi:hypothetical protein